MARNTTLSVDLYTARTAHRLQLGRPPKFGSCATLILTAPIGSHGCALVASLQPLAAAAVSNAAPSPAAKPTFFSSPRYASMPRTTSQRGSGNQANLLLAAACAALGFVGGWSFGHVHGLHACDSGALSSSKVVRPCSPQPRTHLIHQEANRTRHALDDALLRLSKLERSPTKCPKCQSASEAISQIEELENQVRDLTSSHESKGGEASLDMTQWASVRAFDRARLWRETLASLPYVLGTTISRGGLLFTKRKPLNNSLAAAKATCSEIDVVVADSKPDVCLAVFDSRLPIYTMLRTDASFTCVEINSASGEPMTWPFWLGRAVRNRHRHAIEQASHRWRTRRELLISTQVGGQGPGEAAAGAGPAAPQARWCCCLYSGTPRQKVAHHSPARNVTEEA